MTVVLTVALSLPLQLPGLVPLAPEEGQHVHEAAPEALRHHAVQQGVHAAAEVEADAWSAGQLEKRRRLETTRR